MSIWTKTSSGWVEIGGGGSDGLEGLGDWAVISEVSGSPKRYAYNDGPGGVGGIDWVAFEWNVRGTGSVTTTDGILDCLVIAGGGGQNGANRWGSGGNIAVGLVDVSAAPHNIKVGAGGSSPASNGQPSYFADYFAVNIVGSGGFGALSSFESGGDGKTSAPVVSSITGSPVNYGAGAGQGNDPFPGVVMPASDRGPGSGKASSANDTAGGMDGCVIVRVPAAQAAGVDPGSWVTRTAHYAAVDAGVVTDVFDAHTYGDGTVTPLPKTDLVECDQSVQVGWLFDGDSFMEPEPPAPSVFRFDFTKEYSVAGGANHWPMALRVNKTDLDGAEIDLTGWGQARLQFDGKDMTVTVTQIEESSTYWRFTFAEFVNEFDSRLSCEIEISEPAPVRAVSSAVKTAVKSRRNKKK